MIEAQRLEQSRGGEAALLEYDALVKRFPDSVLAPRALAAASQIHFDLGDMEQAAATASQLVDAYSDSGEGAAGLVMQARVGIAQADSVDALDDALTLLKRVPNLFGKGRYPLLEPRAESRVLAGELLIRLGDLGAAAASFVETIEDEPRGRFKLQALLGLGRVLALRGDRVGAMESFQLAIDEGLDNEDEQSARAVADARRRLSLLYRYWLRPSIGQAAWRATEGIRGAGASFEWKKPRGIAASAEGDLVVTDSNVGIVHIQPDGSTSVAAVRNPGHPFFDPSSRRYAPVQSAVRQVDPPSSTAFQTSGEKPKTLDKLQAGARGLLGEWYLVDRGLDGVQVFSEEGTMIDALGTDLDVVDVAVDERGRLFVLSQKPSKITIYELDRSKVSALAGRWSKPVALDVDWLGNIYVLDSASNAVSVTDSTGAEITKIGASLPGASAALRSAEDVAVDGAGRLYIADSRLQQVVRLN